MKAIYKDYIVLDKKASKAIRKRLSIRMIDKIGGWLNGLFRR